MDTGFSNTEFLGIGVAIALVVNFMYQSETNSREPDPYSQYGAYRSRGRAVFLIVIGYILIALTFVVCTWFLGWIFSLYIIGPVITVVSWATWKYYRATATLPPEIIAGLVFLNDYKTKWGPRELQLTVNGWGIFANQHHTKIDAGLTKNQLYLHFDKRLYLVPMEKIQSATPTQITAPGNLSREDAIAFTFSGALDFKIVVAWPTENIGSTIAHVLSQQPGKVVDAI